MMIGVIVTTVYRGVFVGYVDEQKADQKTLELKQARMVLYFGTTRGLFQLAEYGPTEATRITDKADVLLHDVTAVLRLSDRANEAWKEAQP